jgi:RNA polymerase sigma-70 factor (ECF subfamily)
VSDLHDHAGSENSIDSATAGLIRGKSGQIVRQARLPRSDRGDIEQLLTLLVLQRLPRFDPARGDRPAFVRMVLHRATANVLRYLRAARRSGVAVVSLDAFLRTETDEPAHPPDRDGAPGADGGTDLALDLADALEALPADLRAVAEHLRTRSPAQVAQGLGMPRSTLYARTREIRTAFERRALDDYL